jgi:peptidoglycan/LPS O-acetylase OafA/YrhL
MTRPEASDVQRHDLPEPAGPYPRQGPTVRARLRRYVVSVCVLYTVLTLVSSTIALASGQETDTHLHLLMRLLFVMLGLGAFEVVAAFRQRRPGTPLVVLALAGSAVLVVAIVASVWVSGLAGVDLHPNAYRDAVLNVGVVGVVLVALSAIIDLRRRRR